MEGFLLNHERALLLLALLLGLVLVAQRIAWLRAERQSPEAPSWLLPAGAAIVAAALTIWVWGGLRAPPVVDDEAAYVLQADLLARGRWSLPSPPVVAAFTQPAVLVTPVMTPKMAPGHALLLVPGIWLGLPGLVPVLLTALSAALLVMLARRVASSGVALLAVVLWLLQSGTMRWRASYFSEITTCALWLVGWWCLLRWRETRGPMWLVAIAAITGWGAITRPLTMLAWAVPVGIVILRDLASTGRWRDLALPVIVGIACLALMPLQNLATLGDWRQSPRALYTRQYMPFDVVGFGLNPAAPTLPVPENQQRATAGFIARHREHQPAALPRILVERLATLESQVLGGWRIVLLPAAVIGLAVVGAMGWFAVGSVVILYLAYLVYAHEPYWAVYYYEASPIPALVCAAGLAWLLTRLTRQRVLSMRLAAIAALLCVGVGWRELEYSRGARQATQEPFRALAERAEAAAGARALVFIRYAETHDPHLNLVRNVADPAHAPMLTAYDLGPEINAQVAAAYPGRTVLLWDEAASLRQSPATATGK